MQYVKKLFQPYTLSWLYNIGLSQHELIFEQKVEIIEHDHSKTKIRAILRRICDPLVLDDVANGIIHRRYAASLAPNRQ